MAFEFRLTELARIELIALVHWIGEDSPERGERWLVGLRERIATLAYFPHRCPVAREGKLLAAPLRLLTYGKKRRGVVESCLRLSKVGCSFIPSGTTHTRGNFSIDPIRIGSKGPESAQRGHCTIGKMGNLSCRPEAKALNPNPLENGSL